jgi:hypothetical protein
MSLYSSFDVVYLVASESLVVSAGPRAECGKIKFNLEADCLILSGQEVLAEIGNQLIKHPKHGINHPHPAR